MRATSRAFALAATTFVILLPSRTRGQDQDVIPHAQSKPPNRPYSPQEAIAKMVVPKGFQVELVASEPEIVNPVAMTFDDRGRIWITESLEYPRRSAGPGRDRVKILEDTDGDGKADKFTVFAEGLNIPSGIAVGHGGVWVANSPDILFMRDTDGDDKADSTEVVVTGFGRADTHELPNSLSWGPDGWLYGWNGVFNPSHVVYRGKTHDFTCAIFRIHPRTREFEIFCEGTSNPWGIAWDVEGNAFASACVIDHLWHLVESGYYHRQGGPYPPFTWKIGSITDHLHQKAAYCGIHFYDSDAYPPEYRGRLFMGNIHGNCVNVDRLERNGSTYKSNAEPDFLTANDAWFMPVSQKTGPDGSLYVLDWYDRYHCYQDANRDPAGIDRLKGRLYRVRHKDTPRRWNFDLASASDDQLVDLLSSPKSFDRDAARRLLTERSGSGRLERLRRIALDPGTERRTRLLAAWVVTSRPEADDAFLKALMTSEDAGLRAWGVRAAGNKHRVAPEVRQQVQELARDSNPDVLLQVAIAARKIEGLDAVGLLTAVAAGCGTDTLIPRVVWRNLHPSLDRDARGIADATVRLGVPDSPGLRALLPRALEKVLATRPDESDVASSFLRLGLQSSDPATIRESLDVFAARLREGARDPSRRASRARAYRELLASAASDPRLANSAREISMLLAYLGDDRARDDALSVLRDTRADERLRASAFEVVSDTSEPRDFLPSVERLVTDPGAGSIEFRGRVIGSLGRFDSPEIPRLLLAAYTRLEPELKPRVVELLSQRKTWSLELLDSVGRGVVAAEAINRNQARKWLQSNDPMLVERVKARWGTLRLERSAARDQVIAQMRGRLDRASGDPAAGALVFKRVCAQCHTMYGEGQEVGPDITLNGRNSFDQLLSNVFDPSLVIGASYQATTVATTDGRVITGLLAEDSPQRVVLKTQGGKLETIPRGEVDAVKVSELSLMPEDLEKQLQPTEIADLFAYITLDRPPSDPKARRIPGAPTFGPNSR